jgi:GTPase SAR1 family protein
MSFNLNSGYTLAKIIGKGSMNNKIIKIDDKDNVKDSFKDLQLPKQYDFLPIPNKDLDRSTILIVGMAGSGKSYFASQWLKEYHKMYPNYPIYIFSEKPYDEQLDKIKNTQRIKLSPDLAELDYTEFKESCCVFDDVDGLEKSIRKVVNTLRDKLLKLGRSQKTTVLSTNHSPTDGLDTKALLNEAQSIVFFMANYNRSLKYLLENYLGMTKEDIKKCKKNKSRWSCYVKQSYPNVIIQQKNIFVAGHSEDSSSDESELSEIEK